MKKNSGIIHNTGDTTLATNLKTGVDTKPHISRHKIPVNWATCLNMFMPGLVWVDANWAPQGLTLAPIQPILWPIFIHGTLLVRDTAQESVMNTIGSYLFYDAVNQT